MKLGETGASGRPIQLQGRDRLLQYVSDNLCRRGITITDEVIHLRPCGSANPFAGADYAVMVDRRR